LAFLTRSKAKICKILITTLVFEKNASFFAENCQERQKIVIITSTPGYIFTPTQNATFKGSFTLKPFQRFNWFLLQADTLLSGANPTTLEFTTTTPPL
jgi:hypothetical protein